MGKTAWDESGGDLKKIEGGFRRLRHRIPDHPGR
jgi:hypothetical protein